MEVYCDQREINRVDAREGLWTEVLKLFLSEYNLQLWYRSVIDEMPELSLMRIKITLPLLVQAAEELLQIFPTYEVAEHGRDAEFAVEFREQTDSMSSVLTFLWIDLGLHKFMLFLAHKIICHN